MSARPETPQLKRGDTLIVTPERHTFRVTRVGPKWVHVVRTTWFGEPDERFAERSFWREDMTEGRRGDRVGVPSRISTPEQVEYDDETSAADRFIRDVAGLSIRSGSPYADRDMMVGLAAVLRELLPAAGDD